MTIFKSAALFTLFGILLASPAGSPKAAPDNTLGMAIMSAEVDISFEAIPFLVGGAGVVDVWSSSSNRTKIYVRFNRDLQGCTFSATPVGEGELFVTRSRNPEPFPGPGGTTTPDSTVVFTRIPLGPFPLPFSLIVFCPK